MVWEENKVKLLGITMDNELIFDSHILNICSKTNKKLITYVNFNSKGDSLSRFLKAQFKYCLLI